MVQPMEDYNFLNNRNQAIENYIQRVTELTQLKQTIPTNEELLKIASELGISDGEIAIAQKQSQAHFFYGLRVIILSIIGKMRSQNWRKPWLLIHLIYRCYIY